MPYQMDYLEPAPLDPRAEQAMVPMRDGVRLATDVYLPPRPSGLPAVLVRLPYDKCARYTFMPQIAPFVTDRGYAFVVQDVRGKFRSEGETAAVRARGRGRLRHARVDRRAALVGRRRRHVGRLLLRLHAVGGGRERASGAEGHRPASDRHRLHGLRALVGRLGPAAVRRGLPRALLDRPEHLRLPGGLEPPAAGGGVRRRVRGHRQALRGPRPLHAPSGTRRASPIYPPGRHPYECQHVPALHSVGWFDNVAAVLHARLRRTDRASRARRPAVPVRRLDRPRELPARRCARSRSRTTTTATTTPCSASSRGSWRPGLDFFDVFLRGRGGQGRGPAGALAPGPRRMARVAVVAAAGRARAAAVPGRRRARERRRRGRSARGRAGSPQRQRPSGSTIRRISCRRRRSIRSLCCGAGRTRATSRLATTCSPSRATPLATPLDLAGPVTAELALESTCASMHVAREAARRLAGRSRPDAGARAGPHRQRRLRRPRRVDLSHTGYRVLPGHRLRLHVASQRLPALPLASRNERRPLAGR